MEIGRKILLYLFHNCIHLKTIKVASAGALYFAAIFHHFRHRLFSEKTEKSLLWIQIKIEERMFHSKFISNFELFLGCYLDVVFHFLFQNNICDSSEKGEMWIVIISILFYIKHRSFWFLLELMLGAENIKASGNEDQRQPWKFIFSPELSHLSGLSTPFWLCQWWGTYGMCATVGYLCHCKALNGSSPLLIDWSIA